MCSVSSFSTVGWDSIPIEIFFYIFNKLNITSLRCCLAVSRKWREIASYICEKQNLWQALAEDGMVNHGVTQQLKSTLSWKDLYFNSLLWNKLPSAVAYKLHEVEKAEIRNMQVYRDKLIVVNANGVEYYSIENFQTIRFIPTTYCVDVQESDDIFLVVTDICSEGHYRVTVFNKSHKDEEINVDDYLTSLAMPENRSIHAFVDSTQWRLVGNRVYVIDSRYVLWKCSAKYNALSIKALAKFYERIPRRNSTIHVLEKDVYVTLKLGRLLRVKENSMMTYQMVNMMEIPTRIIERSNSNTGIPIWESLNTFSAFTKFPIGLEFRDTKLAPLRMIHYHYDDPEMTCGLQHGDVVFRGFLDGEIKIELLRNGFKHNLNVQQFDNNKLEEPAVIAMDICEIKDMHKLFVSTKRKLYVIVLKYPNDGLETNEMYITDPGRYNKEWLRVINKLSEAVLPSLLPPWCVHSFTS